MRTAESQLGQTEQPPGLKRIAGDRDVPHRQRGSEPRRPLVRLLRLMGRTPGGRAAGRERRRPRLGGQIWSWAQSTGRAIPNGPGVTPQPGDLIVFGDEHVGIVRDVLPSGDIQTIEGNYENKVAANVRTPTEATGYVNMS